MEFTLREWRMEDAAMVARYANNGNIARNLRDGFPYPYTLADAVAYIDACLQNKMPQLCKCIEAGGEPVGSIGVFPLQDVYRKSAEIGYWLAEPFWGQGIMTRAVSMVCEEAFSLFDIERIHAEVFSENPASGRVLEKAGFVLEGVKRKSIYKGGRIMDSLMYARLRSGL